jgi:hypothetical protein
MSRARSAMILLLGVSFVSFVAGCRNQPKNVEPSFTPASETTAAQLQATYQRVDPSARVGVVSDADAKLGLVSVTGINTHDFRERDVVTFIDSEQHPLTTGTVVRVVDNMLHVRYDAPGAGGRIPRKGDLMVRFKPAI